MKKFLLSIMIAALVLVNLANVSATQRSIVVNESALWTQKSEVEKFPEEVLRLVNVEREKVGLSPLRFAKDLEASAYVRAVELPFKFSHTRPDGSKCFTAMAKRGHILGENLAGGQKSPKQVVQAWMDSESHRENILNPKFTELGVVYYYKSDSKYKHYWVQHFRG